MSKTSKQDTEKMKGGKGTGFDNPGKKGLATGIEGKKKNPSSVKKTKYA